MVEGGRQRRAGFRCRSDRAPRQRSRRRLRWCRGGVVGEFGPLQVAPHLFDRVEVVGIGREPFDHQPVALALDEKCCMARLRWDGSPSQMRVTLSSSRWRWGFEEELHDGVVVVGARLHPEHERSFRTIGSEAHRRRHGQTACQLFRWWRRTGVLAPWCPGGPHRGEEAEPALVLEDDPGVPGPGVFFTLGQRSLTHCWMASSSPLRGHRQQDGGELLQPVCDGAPARHARGGLRKPGPG